MKFRFFLALYKLFFFCVLPFIALHFFIRLLRGKELKNRLRERFAFPTIKRPEGPLLWIHAISVGEALSALPLIQKLLEKKSALSILVTTGTLTSARLMSKRLPDRAFHQFFPLDLFSSRFLNFWRPNAFLSIECDLWPLLLNSLYRRSIPALAINAGFSPATFKIWKRFAFFMTPLLKAFSFIYTRSDAYTRQFQDLKVTNAHYVGNLKNTAAPLPYNEELYQSLKKTIGKRPLWLAASTHLGEEDLILKAHLLLKKHFPDLLTIIVPRHPERGSRIAQDFLGSCPTLKVQQRSHDSTLFKETTEIYLSDTLGELGLFYRLSPISFVGGSLVPVGGHNLIEPALLKSALLFGPYTHKCAEIAEIFIKAEAGEVVETPLFLFEAVQRLLTDKSLLRKRQENAFLLAKNEENVLEKIVDGISKYCPLN